MSVGASEKGTGKLLSKLHAWCLHALPPMSGRLRFAYYIFLAASIAALRPPSAGGEEPNPFWAPEDVATMSRVLFFPEGLVKLFGLWPDPRCLVVVRAIMFVAWGFAAIGLFWRASAIITFASFFVLYGATSSYQVTHTVLLPVYALGALCFSDCDDRWTADTYIARRWPRYWFKPSAPDSISRTGFARNLVNVGAVFTLFMPGMAKMFDSGPKWLDGSTLHWRVGLMRDEHATRFPWLADLMLAHPVLFTVGATFAVVVELGAPIALFSRTARHCLVFFGTLLHVGILCLMAPYFTPFIVTYWVLLVDWGSLRRRGRRELSAPPETAEVRWPDVVLLGNVLGFLVVCFWRIEAWPFMSMPMYSSYESETLAGDVPRAAMGQAEVAQRIAKACAPGVHGPLLRGECKWVYPMLIGERTDLRFAGDPTCRVKIEDNDFVGDPVQLEKVIDFAVVHDLAEKPAGSLAETPGQDDEANRFLQRLEPILAPKVASHPECSRIELTYNLDSGPVVIASAGIGSGPNHGDESGARK